MKQFLLVLAVGFATTVSAQKVSNKISFQKGQKLQVTTKAENVISMDMMGQSMDMRLNFTVTRHLDVQDVSGETTTIEHKIKRMQMEVTDPMGNSKTIDSENEADMKEEGGKEIEKAIKNKYTFKVNGKGTVTDVKSDDDNPNKDDQETALPGNMMGNMGSGMGMLPKVGTQIEFAVLPANSVGKGDSWSDSANNVQTKYTITDVTPTGILVSFTSEGKTERVQEANGMEMTIATKDKTTGTLTIDPKTGLVRERSSKTIGSGNMDMAGQSIPIKYHADVTVSMKPI